MGRSRWLVLVLAGACGGGLPTIGGDAGTDASAITDATSEETPTEAAVQDSSAHDSDIDVSLPGDAFACQGTLCGAVCVDTNVDPSNCGACGETCDSGSCVNGECAPSTDSPPQGSCAHSLCATGSVLTEGCDPSGCVTLICDPSSVGDTFCCSSSWDATCVGEVTTYCAPYSCK